MTHQELIQENSILDDNTESTYDLNSMTIGEYIRMRTDLRDGKSDEWYDSTECKLKVHEIEQINRQMKKILGKYPLLFSEDEVIVKMPSRFKEKLDDFMMYFLLFGVPAILGAALTVTVQHLLK